MVKLNLFTFKQVLRTGSFLVFSGKIILINNISNVLNSNIAHYMGGLIIYFFKAQISEKYKKRLSLLEEEVTFLTKEADVLLRGMEPLISS